MSGFDLSEQTDSILPIGGAEADRERALLLCEALAPGTGKMLITTIDGEPASKARPRYTRTGRPYRPRKDVDAEERTAWHLRQIFHQPWTGNVAVGAVGAVFFRPNKQRIDVDNMLKHVCDAANGIAWLDDSQVTALYGVAELDADHPRTILVFARHASTLVRDRGVAQICDHCGREFVRTTSKPQRICSRECRSDWQRGRNRERGKERTPCAVCGGPTSKPGVKRCRSCWRNRGQVER